MLDALENTPNDCVLAFHTFIRPFLYPRDLSGDHINFTKWDDVMECALALYALKEDGNFARPIDITQVFAKIHYHIRGATLYEGLLRKADFNNNPYE